MTGGKRMFWWLMPTACVLAGIGVYLALGAAFRADGNTALMESSLFSLMLFSGISALALLINAYPTKVGIVVYGLVAALLIGITGALLHAFILRATLSAAEFKWLQWAAPFRAILYPALFLLAGALITMQRRIRELEDRYALQQDASALLKEAELFKLRQQLQPHFLYNSLNAVSSLIITAPNKAEEMTGRLADFLRASVKQGRSNTVPLEEELEYLRNYLWIEAARFGERLKIMWDGLDTAPGLHLPPFLLQPLLENAVKFGVYGQTGDVVITVIVALNDSILSVAVANPFDTSSKPKNGTGFGLEGIRRRLYLMYARQDLLRTSITNGIFTATLLIPQER